MLILFIFFIFSRSKLSISWWNKTSKLSTNEEFLKNYYKNKFSNIHAYKRKYNKNRIGYAKEQKRIFAKHDGKYSSKNTIKINESAPHLPAKIMQNQVNKFKGIRNHLLYN